MMKLPWPSITICNNIVLQLSQLNRTAKDLGYVNISNCDCATQLNETFVEEQRQRNSLNIMEYVRTNLSEEERKNQSLATDQWIEKCFFNSEPCNFSNQSVFFEFNNPYNGNCVTFNPAFNDIDGLSSDIDTKLTLHFRRMGTGFQLQ